MSCSILINLGLILSDYSDIKDNKSKMKDIEELTEVMKKFLGPRNVPNESEIIGLYGRVS